jgi:hypothetical protein
MSSLKEFALRRPAFTSAILWALSAVITLGCLTYQDMTGPTYPLEGELRTSGGPVRFKFMRSETIGRDLAIMLLEPVPEGITGSVEYRRYRSNDEWVTVPLTRGEFEFSRRGRAGRVRALGALLPGLAERAGKYEYFVHIDDGAGEPVSVTGDTPIYARYKAEVPVLALIMHIAVIFASMALAVRTALEAVFDGNYKWLLWATVVSLLLGGFVLGPLVQWHAFGVWWSGVPFGYDWTDNKVLVGLAFWLLAAFLNRGGRRSRWSVYLALAVTLIVYFIPHSFFGSEYDYRTGTGRGTTG